MWPGISSVSHSFSDEPDVSQKKHGLQALETREILFLLPNTWTELLNTLLQGTMGRIF